MIDIHTHIIPLIDDGSTSYEESYLMLCEAQQAGFSGIIATSHYIEESYNSDVAQRKEIIEDLLEYKKENNINLNIYMGNEIYVTLNIPELIQTHKASTLADSRYVLFELPMNTNVIYLFQCVYELKSAGYIPIIAHPERYSYIQQNPNTLVNWIEKGILIQSNYTSILGDYGKEAQKTIKKMLKANMVHFLGSDAHRPERYADIPKAVKQIEKCIGTEKTNRITTVNPSYIIRNEEFAIEEVTHIKSGLFF